MRTFLEFLEEQLNEARNTPEVTFFFPLIFGKKGNEEETYKNAQKYESQIKSKFESLKNFKKKLDSDHYQFVIDAIKKANCTIINNVNVSIEKYNKFKTWIKKEYPWTEDYIIVKGTETNLKKISTKVAPFLVHKTWYTGQGLVTRKYLPDEVIIVSWHDEYSRIKAEKEAQKQANKKESPVFTTPKPKKNSTPKKTEVKPKPFTKWNEFNASEFIRYIQDKLSLNPRLVEYEYKDNELTTQYMCKWKNTSDEEDYDWKDLSAASHKAIKSAIAFFNKKYGVTIDYYPQEKEYIIFKIK